MEQMYQTEERFNFKKERSPSELVSATFAFVRQEFGSIYKKLFIWSLPFLIVLGFLSYLSATSISSDFATGGLDTFTGFNGISNLIGAFYIAFLTSYTINYIKAYNNDSDQGEAQKGIMNSAGRLFGLSLATGIIVTLGAVLLIIPGIYLAVAFSMASAVFVIENKGVSDSLRRSRLLIKEYWWKALLALILIGLVYYLLIIILAIPSFIYYFVYGFSNLNSGFEANNILLIITSFIQPFAYLFFSLIVILTTTMYYSRIESTEAPDLMNKIDQLSTDEA